MNPQSLAPHAGPAPGVGLSSALRRDLFRQMVRIRAVEEMIAARYPEQEMRCPVHLSIGQEAVAAGVCSALAPGDYAMSTHRAHAHYLAKGGDLRAMIAEIYGKATGCCAGKGGSMHLVDLKVNMLGSTPIVGSSLPVAVGVAFASVMKNESRVTAVFFGEGATEEGVWAESLNFAALKKLPVLFVCENNLYSVYSPMEVRQPAERDRGAIARAHGIYAASGYGNDPDDVYRVTAEALAHVRSGKGPAFVEFDTYRWREHCGANFDNHIGYRTETEFQNWRVKCPIETYERRLIEEGVLSASAVRELMPEIEREIADAFAFAAASPFPSTQELETHIYGGATV